MRRLLLRLRKWRLLWRRLLDRRIGQRRLHRRRRRHLMLLLLLILLRRRLGRKARRTSHGRRRWPTGHAADRRLLRALSTGRTAEELLEERVGQRSVAREERRGYGGIARGWATTAQTEAGR